MPAEQRGPTIQPRTEVNQRWEEPMPEAKPYQIPKRLVWEAYLRVKANRGAAGIDGETLAAFEKDLKGNLYKVWNRMSSGSYFPPPVRLVEIPKASGGTPPPGIPTLAEPGGADGHDDGARTGSGAAFPSGLVCLRARPFRPRRRGRRKEAVLGRRLGHRSGYQSILR